MTEITHTETLSEENRALIDRNGRLWNNGDLNRLLNACRAEARDNDRIGTHGVGCHTWGPRHYECLLRKFDDLAARQDQAAKTSGGEADWPISTDGPHAISDSRRWLARQLMDSKLTEEEALGIVRYSPAIKRESVTATPAAIKRTAAEAFDPSVMLTPSPPGGEQEAELARLREIAALARELVSPKGMVNRGVDRGLVVIEKADKSDPHYRLCSALEALASPVLDVEDQGSSVAGSDRAKAHAPTLISDGLPRDADGLTAYDIIGRSQREAMARRAGARDRSRDPLLGPPDDMLVSGVLLAARPDINPTEADLLAVKINDALKAAAPQPPESGWRTVFVCSGDFEDPVGDEIGNRYFLSAEACRKGCRCVGDGPNACAAVEARITIPAPTQTLDGETL